MSTASGSDSWVVLEENGSEAEYVSPIQASGGGSVGASQWTDSTSKSRLQSMADSGVDLVVEPLLKFRKWISRGLEASKKYCDNLQSRQSKRQPIPTPKQSLQRQQPVVQPQSKSSSLQYHQQYSTQSLQPVSRTRNSQQPASLGHSQPPSSQRHSQQPPSQGHSKHLQPASQGHSQQPASRGYSQSQQLASQGGSKQPASQTAGIQGPSPPSSVSLHAQPPPVPPPLPPLPNNGGYSKQQQPASQRGSQQLSTGSLSSQQHPVWDTQRQPQNTQWPVQSLQDYNSYQPQNHSQLSYSHYQQQPLPTQDYSKVETSTIKLPSELCGRICCQHPVYSQQILDITDMRYSSLDISDDYTELYISGTGNNGMNATVEIKRVVNRIAKELTDQLLQVHPMYFPLLIDPEAIKILDDMEDHYLVKIELVQCSKDQKGESFDDLSRQWDNTHHTKCIRVSELKEYRSLSAPVSTVKHYEWWVHDRGGVVKLPQEIIQHLNDCCFNQKLDKTKYTHLGKQYVADFKNNILTSVSDHGYTIRQQLDKKPQPSSWSYSTDPLHAEFVPYEPSDSSTIEHMYRYGGYHTQIEGSDVVFDFDPKSMSEINLLTGERYYLRRYPLPEIDTLPEHTITLRIKGLPENVSNAKIELEQILQVVADTVEDKQLLQMFSKDHCETALTYVTNAARQYCVRFTSSRQSENGPVHIQVHGSSSYVTAIHDDLISRCFMVLKFLAVTQFHPQGIKVSTPPPKQTSADFATENVPPHSTDWDMVLGMMQQTMPDVSIQSLQQIHHTYQWDRYHLEMRQMKGNNDNVVNEWYLFHGTRQKDPLDVARSDRGFDFRLSREDCLWGTGVYFAVNASYSDRYHYRETKTGYKQIILARVLTGRSHSFCQKYDNSLRRPPELPSGSGHGLYDTVNGYTNGSFVYVVYDHGKSYPAFIITYK